ncbi:hypothetical protein BDU57DRAFT_445821 [Ampelomyces quisqualis]|uniref:Uncharacterized protein n=1 Tax=Ampelomyces quisqualis TaxID=50730 RepID=A0A6A5QRM9_AMPQU|nr:hypothetical protein BDU57DRAFT_445821 [Ampelomyces quisqualis]
MEVRSGWPQQSDFEISLRIKNALDKHEEMARTEPSARVLAILINCEYLLWHLNKDTPLRHNPFLSHWVEAVQRLEALAAQGKTTENYLSTEMINSTRLLWIKTILQGEDLESWARHTPKAVGKHLRDGGLRHKFDLQTYIRMLEEEGIYEKTPDPAPQDCTGSEQWRIELSPEEVAQQKKDDILRNLAEDPESAIFNITRLPITLSYLDFLTTILADRTLEKHSIDPAPVITQYIQHALRTVERMDKPPSPSSDNIPEDLREESDSMEYGKEAQSRCILLLLLFIKSLIRKRLVELDVLFYEIAEITVRYVWIREVREFRTWVEDGVGARGDAG